MENPQYNSILERINQGNAKLVREFESQNIYLDKDNPWSGILSATDFAVRSTYHTTLQAIPYRLFFGCDMILNAPFISDWEANELRNQKIIDRNNQIENKNHEPHIYRIRDKVLVLNKK